MPDPTRRPENDPAPKKLYQTPQLRIYGNIQALTQNVGKASMMDGFKGFKTA